MSVITVRAGLQSHAITRCLAQRRAQLQIDRVSTWYDYRCGQAHALVCDYAFANQSDTRNELLSRLAQARHAVGAAMLVLVVWMTTTEPALDTLSWVNIQCGLQLRCSVVLCWTTEEMAQFLEALATTFVVSTEYSTHRVRAEAPLPVLIDALTQTPQILQRTDVVRMANRKRDIAGVLSSHPDDFAGIPGLGAKRLARLHALLHVPFVSSQQRVDDVLRVDVAAAARRRGQSSNDGGDVNNNNNNSDRYRHYSDTAVGDAAAVAAARVAPLATRTSTTVAEQADDATSREDASTGNAVAVDAVRAALQHLRDREDAEQ